MPSWRPQIAHHVRAAPLARSSASDRAGQSCPSVLRVRSSRLARSAQWRPLFRSVRQRVPARSCQGFPAGLSWHGGQQAPPGSPAAGQLSSASDGSRSWLPNVPALQACDYPMHPQNAVMRADTSLWPSRQPDRHVQQDPLPGPTAGTRPSQHPGHKPLAADRESLVFGAQRLGQLPLLGADTHRQARPAQDRTLLPGIGMPHRGPL